MERDELFVKLKKALEPNTFFSHDNDPDLLPVGQRSLLNVICYFEANEIQGNFTALADSCNISKSAVSQKMKDLEKLGYIIKLKSKQDNKNFYCQLTEKGLQAKKTHDELLEYYFNEMVSHLGEPKIEEFLSTIEEITKVFKKIKEKKENA